MVQACEIRQPFTQIVGKTGIFRKPKPSQDSLKSRQETPWIQFFSRGRYPKHPLREPRHYMAGPLFKSPRRPWLQTRWRGCATVGYPISALYQKSTQRENTAIILWYKTLEHGVIKRVLGRDERHHGCQRRRQESSFTERHKHSLGPLP